MIAQGRFNPAHLGAIGETVRCVLDEIGADSLEPGDVVLHNDPFRGGCHMPEHYALAPVFRRGRARCVRRDDRPHGRDRRRHDRLLREHRDRGLPGGPPPPAGEARPRRATAVDDIWKIILSNHRTPRSTWGDLHAMIGSLHLAEQRLQELLDRYGERAGACGLGGAARTRRAPDAPTDRGDPRRGVHVRGRDGGRRPHARARDDARAVVVIDGDRAIVDYTGSDPQARGPVNATYGVTVSATCNAFLQVSGREIPRNAGAYGCLKTIAPPGSVVNVALPRAVGGRQHRDAAEARRDAARRLRRGDAGPGDGGRGRHLVQLPLRRQRPEDGRAVRPLPLRGERLGRTGRRRREQRAEPHPRELPQHSDRGLRGAVPVPDARVRARPRLRVARDGTGAASPCGGISRCWHPR